MRVMQTGIPQISNEELVNVGDKSRWMLSSKVPLHGGTGEVVGWSASCVT